MKNLLKAYLILLFGAALGMFLQIAPSLRIALPSLPWADILQAWATMLGMWIWMSAPILLVTGITMAIVLSRQKKL